MVLVPVSTAAAPQVVQLELLNPWVTQSVVGAVAIGAILTSNHRPGRYLGVQAWTR